MMVMMMTMMMVMVMMVMMMLLSAWGETWEISGAKIELLVVRDNFGNPLHPEERERDDDDFKEDIWDNYIGMSLI